MKQKHRILVVDDDRLVADTLSLVYQANGFESEARYSAADGLERARTYDPSVLVCDLVMPLESGLQLVDRMHAELPHCRLLMLTGFLNHAAKVEQQAIKMKRPLKLLQKPCPPAELLRETHALLIA